MSRSRFARPSLRAPAVGIAWIVSCVCGCGTPTTPTGSSATSDPPKIVCPAPQTVDSPDGLPVAIVYSTAAVSDGKPPVTTACTPTSGSTFPLGASTVTCTATDALQRSGTCTFAITVRPPPRLLETSFVAFGDSITWGEDGTDAAASVAPTVSIRPRVRLPISETYPGVLQRQLSSSFRTQSPTVINAGKPAERVTDADTFRRFVSLTASGPYRVVLIMEGTNDLGDRDATVEPAVIAGLQQMIRDAKSRGMRVFLATVPPMNPSGFRGLAWSLVGPFNDRIRTLAQSEDVPLVDVFQGFGNDVTTLIGVDGLHPTAQGYATIADLFFKAIRQTLEEPGAAASGATMSVGRIRPRRQ